MKTLMFDMDNVITDGTIFEYIQEFLNKKLNLMDINTYYLQELINDRQEEFWDFVKGKSFYEKAPLFDGCFEVLKKLNKKYDIYIVTSYIWEDLTDITSDNLKNKYIYLKEKLPFIPPEKYIFTTNKNIINFDIRIDDKIQNLGNGELKLLFSAWHNKNILQETLNDENIIRVDTWYDIEKILLT